MRVALIQQQIGPDPDRNRADTVAAIASAAADGAELVLLQELHAIPYPGQTEDQARFDWAEPIPGPTTSALQAAAAKHRVIVVGSVFERRAAGLYHNTAVVFSAVGRLAGTYRKMHLPDDPGYHEKYFFTPGDDGFWPIETGGIKLGVLVCWDQWFPEAARLMALAGADMLLYPTAIGWDRRDDAAEQARQRSAWQTVQRGHAIANGLPVLACNRVGHEPDPAEQGPGIQFWGSSFVCGPQGEVIAQATSDRPETLLADLDLARNETVRRAWPFFRDRRIDAYQDLLSRWRH